MLSTNAIGDAACARLADDFSPVPRRPQPRRLEPQRARPRSPSAEGVVVATPPDSDSWRIVGSSAQIRAVLADLECVARTSLPVLIMGETGTGKDLMARRLHERSQRACGPWVHVDCTILTAGLIESELYGHVRGAFTGAAGARCGRVGMADGGTLFLDEVGELPLEQQCKLLRLIQHQEFEPIGSSSTVKVDVRIVAATNRDLPAEVAAGRFRADLYYRLAGFPLQLPPLRDRRSDVPALVEHCLRRQLVMLNRPFEMPPDGVIAALQRHSWPGNIRELRSVIERACIRSMGRQLLASDFDLHPVPLAAPNASAPGADGPRARTLREVESEHLQAMLILSGGIIEGREGAAALLGLSPSTLRFRLRRLGIQVDAFRRPSITSDRSRA